MAYNKNPLYGSNSFDHSLPQVLHSDKATQKTHTNSTDAADLCSYSIPANTLEKGDLIRFSVRATITDNNSSDTLTPIFNFGGTAIATGAALDVADSDVIWVDGWISTVTTGSSGTMTAHTEIRTDAVAGTTVRATTALTSKDTTAALAMALNVDWSGAHAENIVRLDSFLVELI
jgi:hypothetical protein